jgi:hypothetical protein
MFFITFCLEAVFLVFVFAFYFTGRGPRVLCSVCFSLHSALFPIFRTCFVSEDETHKLPADGVGGLFLMSGDYRLLGANKAIR